MAGRPHDASACDLAVPQNLRAPLLVRVKQASATNNDHVSLTDLVPGDDFICPRCIVLGASGVDVDDLSRNRNEFE